MIEFEQGLPGDPLQKATLVTQVSDCLSTHARLQRVTEDLGLWLSDAREMNESDIKALKTEALGRAVGAVGTCGLFIDPETNPPAILPCAKVATGECPMRQTG